MKNILCLVWIICLGMACAAQQKSSKTSASPANGHKPRTIWSNRISRIITVNDTQSALRENLRLEKEHKPLAELLTNAVKSGKIRAYKAVDGCSFTRRLTKKQIEDIYIQEIDTLVSDNYYNPPINGRTDLAVVITHTYFRAIKNYRVLEDWNFDPKIGKATVQIIGIAPIIDRYVDGVLRGPELLYWVRYADAKALIHTYEQQHPNCNIHLAVWNDYFLPGN